MNKILATLFLFLPILTNAQTMTRSEVVGVWKVIDGNPVNPDLPADFKKTLDMMLDGFKGSTWKFNENGTFKITFVKTLGPLMEEMPKMLENTLWKLADAKNEIRIGTQEDNFNHLVLLPKKVEQGMKVHFSDIPIYLVLKKEQ